MSAMTLAEAVAAMTTPRQADFRRKVADIALNGAPSLPPAMGVEMALPTAVKARTLGPGLVDAEFAAPTRRYVLQQYRKRIHLSSDFIASLKKVPPNRIAPRLAFAAAISGARAGEAALIGPALEGEKRAFVREVMAQLLGAHTASFARQDAWLLAQAQPALLVERPFAWRVVVSPVQVTTMEVSPLWEYDQHASLRPNESERAYELLCYGVAFVLPEDVPFVSSMAVHRHSNVTARQLPLTVVATPVADPELAAGRASYEEYEAFVARLTGGDGAAPAASNLPVPVDRVFR